MSYEIAVPTTGELINLEDPAQCAQALHEIRTLEENVRDIKRALTEALVEASSQAGIKTLHLGHYTAVIKDSGTILWDLEVLERLLKAGLPQERYDALVTAEVTYKVSASVAKQISAANPKYARIVKKARTDVARSPSVSVTPTQGFTDTSPEREV